MVPKSGDASEPDRATGGCPAPGRSVTSVAEPGRSRRCPDPARWWFYAVRCSTLPPDDGTGRGQDPTRRRRRRAARLGPHRVVADAGGDDEVEELGPWSRLVPPLAIAVVVVGIALRLYSRSQLWLDEALTVNIARLRPGDDGRGPPPRRPPAALLPAPPRLDGGLRRRATSPCARSRACSASPALPARLRRRPPRRRARARLLTARRVPGCLARSPSATAPRPACTRSSCCSCSAAGWLVDDLPRSDARGRLVAVAVVDRGPCPHPLLGPLSRRGRRSIAARGRLAPDACPDAGATFVAAGRRGACCSCRGCRRSWNRPGTPARRGAGPSGRRGCGDPARRLGRWARSPRPQLVGHRHPRGCSCWRSWPAPSAAAASSSTSAPARGAREAAVVGRDGPARPSLAGYATESAFASRYTAVIFPLVALIAGYGLSRFPAAVCARRPSPSLLALGSVGAVATSITPADPGRAVAPHDRRQGAPGDVVAYCPDQLGPAVSRLLPAAFVQQTFPARADPHFVDWTDYAEAGRRRPDRARQRAGRAGRGGTTVWLVSSPPGTARSARKCEQLSNAIGSLAARPRGGAERRRVRARRRSTSTGPPAG